MRIAVTKPERMCLSRVGGSLASDRLLESEVQEMTASSFIRSGLLSILLVPFALGQGHGSGGMQGQGRQGQGQQSGGFGRQDRMRPRANRQQQDQYRLCSRALSRVRKRIRAMARITTVSSINLQQARELNERLVDDLHSMEQEQQSFTGSLTAEQKTAAGTRLQQIHERQQDLESFSEALGFELDQVSVEGSAVQEQVRKLEDTSRSLEEQHHNLAEDLGID